MTTVAYGLYKYLELSRAHTPRVHLARASAASSAQRQTCNVGDLYQVSCAHEQQWHSQLLLYARANSL